MTLIKKTLFSSLGYLFLGTGIAGFILPGLPGAPFILLAFWAFSKAEHPLYNKLLNHPKYGRIYIDWTEGKGIPWKIKTLALFMMWVSISITSGLLLKILYLKMLIILIALGVSFYLLWIVPTRKK
jgi:uncharacterized membrane protein YbaN (DUF454 family)